MTCTHCGQKEGYSNSCGVCRQKRRENSETHKIVPIPGMEGLGWCDICHAAEVELEDFSCTEYQARRKALVASC